MRKMVERLPLKNTPTFLGEQASLGTVCAWGHPCAPRGVQRCEVQEGGFREKSLVSPLDERRKDENQRQIKALLILRMEEFGHQRQ